MRTRPIAAGTIVSAAVAVIVILLCALPNGVGPRAGSTEWWLRGAQAELPRIESEKWRSTMARWLGVTAARAGDLAAVRKAAALVKNDKERKLVLNAAIWPLAKSGDFEAARGLAKECGKWPHPRVLRELVAAGRPHEAMNHVNAVKDAKRRNSLLEGVLSGHCDAGNFAGALETVRAMDAKSKYWALGLISDAQAAHGLKTDALATVEMMEQEYERRNSAKRVRHIGLAIAFRRATGDPDRPPRDGAFRRFPYIRRGTLSWPASSKRDVMWQALLEALKHKTDTVAYQAAIGRAQALLDGKQSGYASGYSRSTVWLHIARTHAAAGKPEKARAAIKAALDTGKTEPGTYYNLKTVPLAVFELVRLGNVAEAVALAASQADEHAVLASSKTLAYALLEHGKADELDKWVATLKKPEVRAYTFVGAAMQRLDAEYWANRGK